MLIDQAGLKGSMVGGAAVSDSHANFFINDKGMGTTVGVVYSCMNIGLTSIRT
jgi:UDP-N-acetylenolpyruvoylglucosamine reductase